MTPTYPLFVKLAGRTVVMVGGGPVATEKAAALMAADATLRVVAPEVRPELEAIAREVRRRPFEAADLDDAWLVVAAAPPEVNRAVRAAADARRLFVLAVDDPLTGTAFAPARFRRGGITVALGSEGAAPALVALLRRALEAVLPEDTTAWEALAARERAAWKRDGTPFPARRPRLLAALVALHEGETR